MSTKLYSRPHDSGRAPPGDPVADSVASRIQQIQSNAKQICTDAADIEDARFLAENIVDTCQRILLNGLAGGPERASALHTARADCAAAAPAGTYSRGPDEVRKAAARQRLAALSNRELEIFTHLAEGRSAAEIAVRLSRSSKTINNHRTRILQKLGLKNATELVRLAVGAELVSV